MDVDKKQANFRSISRRLIVYIVIASSMVTLFLTAFQLYREYQADLKTIDEQFQQIERIYLKSVTETLWAADLIKLKNLLQGMTNSNGITLVSLLDAGTVLIAAGDDTVTNVISRTFPLTYSYRGKDVLIGTLRVDSDLNLVNQRLLDAAVTTLVSNAIKTALVVALMFMIIQRVITRHLTQISEHLRSFSIGNSFVPLRLARHRKSGDPKDELDLVIDSINETAQQVNRAYIETEKAELRFRNYAESSSDWFWEADEKHRMTHVSERYFEVTGVESKIYIGKRRWDNAQEDTDNEKWARHMADLVARRPFRGFSYNIKTSDGRRLTIVINGIPIFDQDGVFIGYRGTGSDITLQRVTEEQRDAALREAERANRAKSEFLATMSHEFRTPLNAILGFSEMMRAQYFGPLGSDNYQEYANDIHDSGEHMLELVNDVLDIAAIEAGKRAIIKETINVNELLRDCVRNIELVASGGGIKLTLDGPEDLPRLFADKRSVTQIVLNIISNAVKFTEEDGTIAVSAAAEGNNTIIKVSDSGAGIPPDKLPSITEPFSQAHTDPHKAQKGTGLGLSIVKSLVNVHDGVLDIESELGKGTTVIVTLPSKL